MRHPLVFILGVLAVCATLLVVSSRLENADGDRRAVSRATNVATVDIEDVIDDYVQKTGAYEALRNQYNTKRRALTFLQEQVRNMTEEAEIYPRDSERFIELQADIQTKRAQAKFEGETTEAWYDSQQAKLTRESYTKALEVIERVARQKNLDLVFMRKDGRVEGRMMNQVSSSIVVRAVVFAKDSLDITDEVKALLNK
jgi:Skp family chaperone for outer membrane proteins